MPAAPELGLAVRAAGLLLTHDREGGGADDAHRLGNS